MNLEMLSQRADIWRGGQTPPAVRQTLPSGYDKLDEALNNGGWPVGELIELYSDLDLQQKSTRASTNKLELAGGRAEKTLSGAVMVNTQSNTGHLKILMPMLARLSQQSGLQRRWIAWVAPPYIPYAPALSHQGIDLSSVLLIHPKSRSPQDTNESTHNEPTHSSQPKRQRLKNQQLKNQLWAAEQALASNTCGAVLMWIHGAKDRDLRRLHLAAQRGNTLGILFPAPSAINNPSPAPLRIVTRRLATQKITQEETLEIEIIKQRGAGARKKLYIANSHNNEHHDEHRDEHHENDAKYSRSKNGQMSMDFDFNQTNFNLSQNTEQRLHN